MIKKISILGIFILTLLISNFSIGEEIQVSVEVDNEQINFPDAQPFIDTNSRTQIPAKYIGEELGAIVTWNGATREATFTKNDQVLVFTIGKDTYVFNGNELKMDTEATIYESRTYVPAKYITESFGATIEWHGPTRTVRIYKDISKSINNEAGVTYYDNIAFDPEKDADIYGKPEKEKAIEFYLNVLDYLKFSVEDGVYYIEGFYPEVPEGYTLRILQEVHYYDMTPDTYYPINRKKELIMPTSGSYKMKAVVQDMDRVAGIELVIDIVNKNLNSEYTLLLQYGDPDYFDNMYKSKAIDNYGTDSVNLIDRTDFEALNQWKTWDK